jgi:hypothetical protein
MPYIQFELMFYMPTGACSRGYKLRSREGECPKYLGVVVSYECFISECVVMLVLFSMFHLLVFYVPPSVMVPASPFIVQEGLVYKG